MKLQVAMKKIEGKYEAALIVDDKFARSGVGFSASELLGKFVSPFLGPLDEDVEVSATIFIIPPTRALPLAETPNES